MTDTLDGGPVIVRHHLTLDANETQGTYAAKVNDAAPLVMKRLHELLMAPPLPAGEVQHDGHYYPAVQETGLEIDFSQPIAEVDALVRACNPYHPARVLFRGRELWIHETTCLPGETGAPGSLTADTGELVVNCGNGRLRLDVVNRPGEGVFSGPRFAALYQVATGETLE